MNPNSKLPLAAHKLVVINNVKYYVPESLAPGDSFFIPSLVHPVTFAKLIKAYESDKYTLKYAERIEAGLLGIRVWRVA